MTSNVTTRVTVTSNVNLNVTANVTVTSNVTLNVNVIFVAAIEKGERLIQRTFSDLNLY